MKKYNLFILLPHLPLDQTKNISQEIIKIVEKIGGRVEKWEEYGKRKLSYAIKKIRYGFYLDYVLNLPTEKIESRILEIAKELKLKPEILRFELSHYKDTKTPTSRPASQRGEQKQTIKKSVVIKESKKSLTKQDTKRSKISMEELDKKLENILKAEDV